MKVKVKKSEILPALRGAFRAISTKSPLPILTGMKFEALEEGVLSVAGTDLEIVITCTIPAEVDEPGTAVLPAVTTIGFIEKLAEDIVIADTDSAMLTIKSGKVEADICVFPADEYPEILSVQEEELKFVVNAKNFCDMLFRTVYAASDKDSRPQICGVNFEVGNGELVLAATDTHRLSIGRLALEGISQQKTVIVPKKTVEEIVKLYRDKKDDLAVVMGSNQIGFVSGNTTVVSRIIEGLFPNYRAVLPKDFITTVEIDPVVLLDTLERAKTLAINNESVMLHLRNNFIEVSLQGESCKMHETVNAEVCGNEMRICFSARYLIEAVKNTAAGGKKVQIGFVGPLNPIMLMTADGSVISLVLPRKDRDVAKKEAQKAS